MALPSKLQQRVRARKFESDEEDEANISSSAAETDEGSDSDGSMSDGGHEMVQDIREAKSNENEVDDDESDVRFSFASLLVLSLPPPNQLQTSTSPPPHEPLSTISFGALASAATSLTTPRKRPAHAPTPSRSPSPFPEAAERLAGKKAPHPSTRTSKHAPTELSAKRAVSRKRAVVPTAVRTARDPRFSALSGALDEDRLRKNYAFLTGYRASEMAELRTRIRKTKDAAQKEGLKRELMVMESRERAEERKLKRQEVVREHRRKEREAVQGGKTPFFLKKAEIEKRTLVKRFEGLGEKKVARVVERRRKKLAGRERREMPVERRGADG
jgi:ribosomal RNA-processing protein 36